MQDKYREIPTFKLRRKCIAFVTRKWKPLRFIEFGAGTGIQTRYFLDRDYSGTCYDIGEENRETINRTLSEYGEHVDVVRRIDNVAKESFDYVFAFDVIEHIEDDNETLRLWTSYLKPGGTLLISVPAHKKKFGTKDMVAGHYRRYEKNELFNLMKKSGYRNIHILCYGFPLLNITGRAIDFLLWISIRKKYRNLTYEERSIKGGVETPEVSRKLTFMFTDAIIVPFALIQKLFYNMDIGVAYVAFGEKK